MAKFNARQIFPLYGIETLIYHAQNVDIMLKIQKCLLYMFKGN